MKWLCHIKQQAAAHAAAAVWHILMPLWNFLSNHLLQVQAQCSFLGHLRPAQPPGPALWGCERRRAVAGSAAPGTSSAFSRP